MRSSNDQSGIVHQMNTSLLPDVATHFGAVMSCEEEDQRIGIRVCLRRNNITEILKYILWALTVF